MKEVTVAQPGPQRLWRAFLRYIQTLALLILAALGWESVGIAQRDSGPAATVRRILSAPDSQLDYGRAKLAFDRIVDPSLDVNSTSAEIDRLARSATTLAGNNPASAARLTALRSVIYESGEWNGSRPFAYDHADPLGRNIRNKLISTYLATRRGNCVSIVGERMGLNLALSTAPLHLLLRYTDEDGHEINLEATSGAHPARTL